MFEKIAAQLSYLEKSLSNEKYLSKFDALSLSKIENTKKAGADDIPKLLGLERLVKELSHILNEGHIEFQTLLPRIKEDLQKCKSLSREIVHYLRPFDEQHEDNQLLLLGVDELTLENIKQMEHKLNSMELNHHGKTLDMQLRPRLHSLYNEISKLIEVKLEMLLSLQNLVDSYSQRVVTMASENGVLSAVEKTHMVLATTLNPLLKDRFFSTTEENVILQELQSVWAYMVLGSTEHKDLASAQLSKSFFENHLVIGQERVQHIKLGAIVILLLWAFSECLYNERHSRTIWKDPMFSIFMCFGDLLLLLLMWGVSVHVWSSHGIDYMELLELTGTEFEDLKEPAAEVYRVVSNHTLTFLGSFILFNKCMRGFMSFGYDTMIIAHTIATAMVIYFSYCMISPWSTRKQWWFMLWRVIMAPLYSVNFRDGYIGDLLTSLVRVLIPLVFSVIFVFVTFYAWLSNDLSLVAKISDKWWSGTKLYKFMIIPFITLLPLWIRLMQCLRRCVESGKRWPHLGNSLKYTSAIIVISYGSFQPELRKNPLWISSFVFATLFQFTWDLTQDWGMISISFESGGRSSDMRFEYGSFVSNVTFPFDFLTAGASINFRKERLLGPIWRYIIVVLCNLGLRFAWTLTLLSVPPDGTASTLYQTLLVHLGPVLAAIEILRRMVWGFFRLEYEQVEKLSKSSMFDDEKMGFMKNDPSFDKMGISSGIEMVEQGSSGYAAEPTESSRPDSFLEMDFWSWALPPYCINCLDHLPIFRALDSQQSKLRLVEVTVFVIIVSYIVALASEPTLPSLF